MGRITPPQLSHARASGAFEALVDRTGAATGDVPTLQGDGTLAFAAASGGEPQSALYLPGVVSNTVTTPDHASLDVAGVLDIMVRVALDDWDGGNQCLVGRWAASNLSYAFRINTTTGYPYLAVSEDGATERALTGTQAVPTTDGEFCWLRVTKDPANGFATFHVADDADDEPASWTSLGVSNTNASAAAAPFAGTSPLTVGARGSDLPMTGKLKRVIIRDGATLVTDLRLTRPVDPRFRDSTGKVWTFNGTGYSWMVG